jgi:hypothetical protein
MELVPCNVCRRHVSVGETTCPFCAAAVPAQRARRFAPRGRITRAAVFSAALVGCESKQTAPTPVPAPQQQGSDDLEKMLDGDHHVVDRPAPATDAAVAADATEIAAGAIDAGVPADAGVDEKALAEKREKQRKAKERRLREERERKQLEDQVVRERDWHNIAKPYGAPPARRRVV